jgi:hypothetical protein
MGFSRLGSTHSQFKLFVLYGTIFTVSNIEMWARLIQVFDYIKAMLSWKIYKTVL